MCRVRDTCVIRTHTCGEAGVPAEVRALNVASSQDDFLIRCADAATGVSSTTSRASCDMEDGALTPVHIVITVVVGSLKCVSRPVPKSMALWQHE